MQTENIKWIDFSEAKPKKGYYLVTTDSGWVCEAFYNPKRKNFTLRDLFEIPTVIAWAELPKGFTPNDVKTL